MQVLVTQNPKFEMGKENEFDAGVDFSMMEPAG